MESAQDGRRLCHPHGAAWPRHSHSSGGQGSPRSSYPLPILIPDSRFPLTARVRPCPLFLTAPADSNWPRAAPHRLPIGPPSARPPSHWPALGPPFPLAYQSRRSPALPRGCSSHRSRWMTPLVQPQGKMSGKKELRSQWESLGSARGALRARSRPHSSPCLLISHLHALHVITE